MVKYKKVIVRDAFFQASKKPDFLMGFLKNLTNDLPK